MKALHTLMAALLLALSPYAVKVESETALAALNRDKEYSELALDDSMSKY